MKAEEETNELYKAAELRGKKATDLAKTNAELIKENQDTDKDVEELAQCKTVIEKELFEE